MSLASSIFVLGIKRLCLRKVGPWPWPRILLCSWRWPQALRPVTPPLVNTLEIREKLKTASLNPKFTGSY